MKDRYLKILKMAIAFVAFGYIVYAICGQIRKGVSLNLDHFSLMPMLIAVLLVPVNWVAEALKWRCLTVNLQKLSLLQSVRSVLTGLAYSMLTPNRIGDFAGRIMTLDPENRTKGAMSSFVGSLAQVIAIATFGVVAFVLDPQLPDVFQWLGNHFSFTLVVLVTLLAVFFCLYLFVGEISSRFKFKAWPWLERFVTSASLHTKRQLEDAFLLSCLRYAVFSGQFFLVLMSVGMESSALDLFSAIAFTYCIVTLIPTFALFEWGVRGSVALIFLAPLGGQPAQIVGATVIVWLMNVGIPALAGVLWSVKPTRE